MDIKEAFKELKTMVPGGYVSIDYTLSRFTSGDEEAECSVYINGVGFFPASTIEKALDRAKERLQKIKG